MAGIIFSEGSGIADSVFGKSQEPIKALIKKNVESFEEMSALNKLYKMGNTKNFAEKFTGMTSLGNFQNVGENGAYPVTSMREGYSKVIEPQTWKNKFEVTQEMIEDEKNNLIASRAALFAQAFQRTREMYGAAMLAAGTATTTTIGGIKYDTTTADKVALFSAQHPSITNSKYKQSNKFAGALTAKVFDTMQEKMQKFTDDDGNLLNVAPDTIIIPNRGDLKRKILEIVGSDLDPETNNNGINFQMGLWNVIIWNYLPAQMEAHDYFLMADSNYLMNLDCLPWLDRVPLTVKSDIDPNTDANVFKGRARFGAGFNNWRGLAICQDGGDGTDIAGV